MKIKWSFNICGVYIFVSHLKLVLVAGDRGTLLVPKIVRLDDHHILNVGTKMLLQYLEYCFDAGHVIAVAAHVHQHGETDRFR